MTGEPGQQARQPRSLPAGLAKPAQRALAAAGYTTLEQLTQVSEADLGRMHGLGLQDKVWAHDPDGLAWEYYTVLEHIQTP